MPTFYAHSLEHDPNDEHWQELPTHLNNVANLAAKFSDSFDSKAWGYVAGLWHDLGKFDPGFQRKLRGERISVEHSGQGAALADSRFREYGKLLAFLIAGHHAGLANPVESGPNYPSPLQDRVRRGTRMLQEILDHIPESIVSTPQPDLPKFLQHALDTATPPNLRCLEFWLRFLFSALIDADRLDTRDFCEPNKGEARGGFDSIQELRTRIDAHLGQKLAGLSPIASNSPVNMARASVLDACRRAAELSPRFFSITVPTGGGKTLSSLAFALRHAERHGLQRIIVVIPYTSIIEQNAAVYRDALGPENVVEHHSNVDDERASREYGKEVTLRHQFAAENWDAPVIVTTTVQFFESLFSNRPSKCRKLHNIARSVIILDEVQSLPPKYLLCILDGLKELVANYGCSVVLSTATPPALAARDSLPDGIDGIHPITPDASKLAEYLRRVHYEWPCLESPPTPWVELAQELRSQEQVLAIVHRRNDARELATLLQQLVPADEVFHLSALMCPAHRTDTLKKIRERLDNRSPCKAISTQLVEAGVDIDFPVVYRALAGLDSIVQAAGRCNREGARDSGRVVVFRAPTSPPGGVLVHGLQKMESMLREHGGAIDPASPETCDRYFRRLYQGEQLDPEGIQPARAGLNFATVAAKFQIIEDGFTRTIVVPYRKGLDRLQRFRRELGFPGGPSKYTYRGLQPYLVQVYPDAFDKLYEAGAIEEIANGIHTLSVPFLHLYDETFGLVSGEVSQANPEALIL